VAKASKQSTPTSTPAGKLIFASARLDAKLDDPNIKSFLQAEARSAIKRGQDAKKVLKFLPPSPVGRPKKYASIIADAKQRIETGAVELTPRGLTKFVRSLTTSTAARKTIRNNLRPIWNAALKK
jgi:hypothetical protein